MVCFEDVQAAAQRLTGIAHRTPIATSRLLDDACRSRVFLKCENLQRAGAFKFRALTPLSAQPDVALHVPKKILENLQLT